MPHWTSRAPADDPRFAFRILRTPAKGALDAIITSTDIVGTATHFVNNRTVPCEDPKPCPICEAGHSRRWHGYLSAILCNSYEHFLFEFTRTAAATFETYLTVNASLRACRFRASRPRGHHNSRVLISCRHLDDLHLRLPDPPNVIRILCHIWNIPFNPVETFSVPDRPGKQLSVPPGNGDGRYAPNPSPKDASHRTTTS